MCQQIKQAKKHCTYIVSEKGYTPQKKMLVVQNVYVCHRDPELLEEIEVKYPNIVILFIPANLTKICQPLDIWFNAQFKVTYATIRNTRVAKLFAEQEEVDRLRIEALPSEERAAEEKQTTNLVQFQKT